MGSARRGRTLGEKGSWTVKCVRQWRNGGGDKGRGLREELLLSLRVFGVLE